MLNRRAGCRLVRAERGGVVILVPAGVLVLVVLGAIAVDSAVAYLGQRQLSDAVSAAAADAAGAALSRSAFYAAGGVRLDPATAATVVCQTMAAQADGDLHQVRVAMALAGPAVLVEATAEVDPVFARPFVDGRLRQVRASAVAVAEQHAGELPPPTPVDPAPLSC